MFARKRKKSTFCWCHRLTVHLNQRFGRAGTKFDYSPRTWSDYWIATISVHSQLILWGCSACGNATRRRQIVSICSKRSLAVLGLSGSYPELPLRIVDFEVNECILEANRSELTLRSCRGRLNVLSVEKT